MVAVVRVGMRHFISAFRRDHLTAFLLFACGCARAAAPDAQRDSSVAAAAWRDTLIQFGHDDQVDRDSVGVAATRNDTVYLRQLARADSVRFAWLKARVQTHGWPRQSVAGERAAHAAWLIIQHSPDFVFQATMLPELSQLAAVNEIPSADVAMLADRVAVHQNRPQRYGTQFQLRDGALVADSIENMALLDSLRADVRLPPMQEYAKILRELYNVPVEWPPHAGR